jgi:hypothetical protein
VRIIEEITFPENLTVDVCVDKGMIRYQGHNDESNPSTKKGIVYSLFDIDGNPITPKWTDWEDTCIIHRSLECYVSDDDTGIYDPLIDE